MPRPLGQGHEIRVIKAPAGLQRSMRQSHLSGALWIPALEASQLPSSQVRGRTFILPRHIAAIHPGGSRLRACAALTNARYLGRDRDSTLPLLPVSARVDPASVVEFPVTPGKE